MNLVLPAPSDDYYPSPTVATEDDISWAISSFPPASAGGGCSGADGLHPCHLRAILGREAVKAGGGTSVVAPDHI